MTNPPRYNDLAELAFAYLGLLSTDKAPGMAEEAARVKAALEGLDAAAILKRKGTYPAHILIDLRELTGRDLMNLRCFAMGLADRDYAVALGSAKMLVQTLEDARASWLWTPGLSEGPKS